MHKDLPYNIASYSGVHCVCCYSGSSTHNQPTLGSMKDLPHNIVIATHLCVCCYSGSSTHNQPTLGSMKDLPHNIVIATPVCACCYSGSSTHNQPTQRA